MLQYGEETQSRHRLYLAVFQLLAMIASFHVTSHAYM
jgi:hypothetical protein